MPDAIKRANGPIDLDTGQSLEGLKSVTGEQPSTSGPRDTRSRAKPYPSADLSEVSLGTQVFTRKVKHHFTSPIIRLITTLKSGFKVAPVSVANASRKGSGGKELTTSSNQSIRV